jgi:diguanylate cyclase (GGDEF)-like protein/PAS domain S-box-containing protein
MPVLSTRLLFDEWADIFAGLPVVFYRFTQQRGGTFYSPQVETLLGYRVEQLLAEPMLWHDAIHPDDLPTVDHAIAALTEASLSFDLEYRIRHRNGHWIWLHDRCVRRVDTQGEPSLVGMVTDISARRAAETLCEDSKQQLSQILDSLDVAVLLYDTASGSLIRASNAAACKLFGYSPAQIGHLNLETLHLEPAAFESFDLLSREALRSEAYFFTEWPLRRADHSVFPAELRIRRLNSDCGAQLFIAVITDLTEKYAYEEDLALAQQVFDNASEAVMITDAENRIVSVNTAFTIITGWSLEESVGRNPSFLSSGKQGPDFYRDMWQVLHDAGVWQGEVVNRRRSGQYYAEWLSISTVRNRQGKVTHYLAIFSDISERKRAEGLIHRYSWFDSLTDLPNKALLIDRVNQAIITAQNEGRPLYLIALNLNRLKQINDSFGHRAGDEVLKVVAQRLVDATREGDTASRITGDDFVVLAPRLSQHHRALALSQRLLDSVNAAISIEGNTIHISANCGISVFPSDGRDPEVLLMNADAALNHSRNQGPNKAAFFEPHMNTEILEKIGMQGELKSALDQGEFLLHFQPQINLTTGKLAGVEALIRWIHPERGVVSPAQFIPMAEDLGLIIPIGEWVIDEACRCLARWRQAGHRDLLVAVNLSAHQFTHANLIPVVKAAIKRHAIPPACLEMEITEGVAMHDADEVLTRLQELKNIGVKISIDDFGTGYSSLAYLRRFPVDKLKIDQSFIRDMLESSEATSIVRAVVALAHGLSLCVIAEGVETTAQRDILLELGCDEIQGYLLSRPISFEDMTSWLAREPAASL